MHGYALQTVFISQLLEGENYFLKILTKMSRPVISII